MSLHSELSELVATNGQVYLVKLTPFYIFLIKVSLHSELSELAATNGQVNLVPFVLKVVSDLRAVNRQG